MRNGCSRSSSGRRRPFRRRAAGGRCSAAICEQLEARLSFLGGDPTKIIPSPTGNWRGDEPGKGHGGEPVADPAPMRTACAAKSSRSPTTISAISRVLGARNRIRSSTLLCEPRAPHRGPGAPRLRGALLRRCVPAARGVRNPFTARARDATGFVIRFSCRALPAAARHIRRSARRARHPELRVTTRFVQNRTLTGLSGQPRPAERWQRGAAARSPRCAGWSRLASQGTTPLPQPNRQPSRCAASQRPTCLRQSGSTTAAANTWGSRMPV